MKHLRRILMGAAAVALSAGITAAQFGGAGSGVQVQQRNSDLDPLMQQLLGGSGFGGGGTGFGGGGGGRGGRGGGGRGGRGGRSFDDYLTGNEAIDIPLDRSGVAVWDPDPVFKNDTFTFVRLRFTTATRGGFGGGGTGGTGKSWLNDWPTGDVNISFRLQQMTALKVNPVPVRLQITDERLMNYPFALMNQVGGLQFTDREVVALRRWLLNGGFLMIDDHWGLNDQRNWAQQIRRVFHDREPVELPLTHPIFHSVYDFKKLPQVPTLQMWLRDAANGNPERTTRGPDDPPPVYRGIFDDHGRLMVLENANTDTTDGWQREGDEEEYFHRFAEKTAYPWMINVIFYAMTH